jgi:hydrogenase maturation protease
MTVETDTSLRISRQSDIHDGSRVLVLGLGNLLLRDEGIGVHVAHELQKQDLPANVEVIDGGTAGMDVILSRQGLHKLVVVDAIRSGNKPGTVYKTRLNAEERDELARLFGSDEGSMISLHQLGLINALAVAEKLNCLPREIVIIGVEPSQISPGLQLTEQVEQTVPKIINTVLEEIEDAVHTR